MIFSNNKNFYPTPPALASRMVSKIKGYPSRILEPSAGKGDLIEAVRKHTKDCYRGCPDIFAIEIDPMLQAVLLKDEFATVIDSDFLAFSGPDQFDLIIANPPFEDGALHLQKALNMMYRGQIIFLLNAETLRNPHSMLRRALVNRLTELGAEIEYIPGAFLDAERTTAVEVALVSVIIDRKAEDDLFAGTDDAPDSSDVFTEKHEVSRAGRGIEELVAGYNRAVDVGLATIRSFYQNYRHIGSYLTLNDVGGKLQSSISSGDLTSKLQKTVNRLVRDVRADYWRRTLSLKEVRSRMTTAKTKEFEYALSQRCNMDFTEGNLRQFVLNVIAGYEQTMTDAVLDLFDMFTIRHRWDEELFDKNIHYFNGWKTNQAYKVGRRVVIPIRASYGSPFTDYGKWRLDYQASEKLDDIDKVFAFFDGNSEHVTLSDAVHTAFKSGTNSGSSSYFKFTCHKKGTIHLTFLDDDILRRFNVVACRGKGWLPFEYGAKSYTEMDAEERAVVESFEGEKSYNKSLGLPLFAQADLGMLQIGYKEAA